MCQPGSVTRWIAQLKGADQTAAQRLWEKYFGQLVARARHKLAGAPRRAADEADVVQSAFASFFQAAQNGRFPRLHDRHDLWQLLVLITDRKACDLANRERRQRRGGGKVFAEADLGGGQDSARPSPLGQLISEEPSPEFAALAAEEYRRLLDLLGDADLQHLAVLKMEGYTVEEIAARLGRVPRTVKRRLHMIRQIWDQELPA
jgi:RNA polymerase sigma factor (sigma-70 family)